MSRHRGVVKWFNRRKGFGFVCPDDPSISNFKDVFLHADDVGDELVDTGMTLEFALDDNRGKGLKAIHIEIVSKLRGKGMRTRQQIAAAFRGGHLSGLTQAECDMIADCLEADTRGIASEAVNSHLTEHARLGEHLRLENVEKTIAE